MKSYLSLIPISARVHKRQNRMTLLCIIISVLLVTAIFGAADMTLRGETLYMQGRHGSWHISLSGVSDDVIRAVSQRDDVTAVGSSAVFNFDADLPYYIGKRTAALYGKPFYFSRFPSRYAYCVNRELRVMEGVPQPAPSTMPISSSLR